MASKKKTIEKKEHPLSLLPTILPFNRVQLQKGKPHLSPRLLATLREPNTPPPRRHPSLSTSMALKNERCTTKSAVFLFFLAAIFMFFLALIFFHSEHAMLREKKTILCRIWPWCHSRHALYFFCRSSSSENQLLTVSFALTRSVYRAMHPALPHRQSPSTRPTSKCTNCLIRPLFGWVLVRRNQNLFFFFFAKMPN
ncbi:hypothetical protein BC940DRAFT_299571 [Gongronella butleri]|nr:hypothetical protein BC940DRAFT_299571 [Gongronella butleri]